MPSVSPSGAPLLNGNCPASFRLSRATSKPSAVRQLYAQQQLLEKRLANPELSTRDALDCSRLWIELRNQIRIEKGWIKPGSRNVSVREPHPSEVKRLKSPAAHSSLYDYASEAPAPEPVKPTDQAATSDPNGATGA